MLLLLLILNLLIWMTTIYFSEAFFYKSNTQGSRKSRSNGRVERLNGVLGKFVLKILNDVNYKADIEAIVIK